MKNKGLRIVAMLLMVAMFLPTIVACSKGDKDGDANTGVNANNEISESTDSEDSTGNQSTTFTVIFEDFDGTVLKKIEGVEKGDIIYPPENPTREGYYFVGWNKNFENIESDLTITAQYQTLVSLTTPIITEIKYDTIYWTPIENADTYTVCVNDNYTCTLKGTSCQLKDVKWNGEMISTTGQIKVTVTANTNGIYSECVRL